MRNRINVSDVCSANSALSRRAALLLSLLAVIFANAGCIKKAAPLTSGNLNVSFMEAPPGSVQTGGQATLVAVVANDSANLGVDWNVSCESPSPKCGTFNPPHTMSGQATVYTAPSLSPTGGTVNITAMATSNHAIAQTVPVLISNSISIAFTQAPPATMQANSSVQVVAQVTGDSTGAGVAWTLTCSGSTNCGGIGPTPTLSGSSTTFTAPSAPGVMVTIIAQSVASPSVQATSIVSITAAAGPSISFNQAPPSSLFTNGVSFITASVINDLSNAGIDWSLTCAGPGSCGSLSATHSATDLNATISYTAPATPPGGNNQVTITAAATVAPNPSVSASITISIPVISVSISGAPSQLPVNIHTALSAIVTNDTTNSGVSWSVTCTGGSCGTFPTPHTTLSGVPIVYTAPSTVPPGNTVTITATSIADGTKSASATVTITPAGSIAIAFSSGQPNTSMLAGAAQNITANISQTPPPVDLNVNWTVSCNNTASSGSCGTFAPASPAQTLSGSPMTYTAPGTIPSAGLFVTVTAAADTSPTTTVSGTILVTVATTGVTLSTVPSTLSEGATQSITATLTNDPGHLGVNWTATCTQGTGAACGSFSQSPTDTGIPTSYTAPLTQGTVTITATSVDSPSVFATATVTIQPSASDGLLSGHYALSLTGTSGEFGFYAVVGSVVADGAGDITGEEDFNCSTFKCPTGGIAIPSLSGSTYTVGPDGRGTMSLHTGNFTLGIQTLHFVIVNAASGTAGSALIMDTDTGANASGNLDFQTSADFTESAIAGSYAFTFSGADFNNGNAPTDFGGTFTISGANFTGKMDTNDQGGTGGGTGPTVVQNSTFSGALSSPDSNGRGTFTSPGSGNMYIYYVVSSGFLKFLEEDGNFLAAGSAFVQGGTFSSGTTYAFTTGGESGLGSDGSLSASNFVMGGLLSPGSGTTLNGVVDVNISTVSPLVLDTTFAGTFSAPSNGRGTLTFPAGTTGGTGDPLLGPSLFAYYPTASHGILMMNLDPPTSSSPGYTAIGTALAQTQGAAFSGNYAMNFSEPAISDTEDVVGQVIPTPTNNPPTLAGTVDENNGEVATGLSLVGSFTANSTGRLPGSFTIGTDPTQTEVFYVVNANTVLCIEMDANDQTAGILEIQNLQ